MKRERLEEIKTKQKQKPKKERKKKKGRKEERTEVMYDIGAVGYGFG